MDRLRIGQMKKRKVPGGLPSFFSNTAIQRRLSSIEQGNAAVRWFPLSNTNTLRNDWLAILGLIALASFVPSAAVKSSDGGNATTARRAGADWWSLQPVKRPEIPKLAVDVQPANPIDAFIRQALADRGLSPNPPVDRRTLIRRAYFDVIGLPPAPEDVDAFLKDSAADAYEKVIDRLLASPQYGVRCTALA